MAKSGWLVVMTKPRVETEAKIHLEQQGFVVYLPKWVELRRRSNRWEKIETAMFPRYLFVKQAHVEQSISPIRSTRAVSQLVRFGTEPAMASETLINEIQLMESSRCTSRDSLKPFKCGDEVIVMDGPFKGVSAEVLSSYQQRVVLLFQVLGKNQQMEFEAGVCQVR
ncbi:KOW motif-containing protein [Vibrio profundum]|uniref:transcription termination/antitermination NusG family protein n=1 Tax=Vibrio profundum TaxID=2910247 RepID=UPI003D102760